jgi:hypothetical protein
VTFRTMFVWFTVVWSTSSLNVTLIEAVG